MMPGFRSWIPVAMTPSRLSVLSWRVVPHAPTSSAATPIESEIPESFFMAQASNKSRERVLGDRSVRRCVVLSGGHQVHECSRAHYLEGSSQIRLRITVVVEMSHP